MEKKRYYQFFGSKKINKSEMKKKINFDFMRLIDKVENGHKMKGHSKKLISPSSILRPIKDYQLFSIPKDVLEQRRQDGITLMKYLEIIFKTKETDINSFPITTKQKRDLHNIFKYFIDNDIQLLSIEKPITNGVIYGIVDCIIKKGTGIYVLEIKLRNNLKIENADLFQAKVYSMMLGLPAIVLCLADNGETNEQLLYKTSFNKELKVVKDFYKLFGIDLEFNQRLEIR